MFDLMQGRDVKARDALRESAATSLAVVSLLIDKGVFTEDELRASHLQATAALDQHVAKVLEERAAEVAAMSTVDRLMHDIFGVMPDDC
jgi:hypothetical protein